ncbi:MAG: circadian clock KaiB family protein [Rhizobacter sp.]
MNGKTPLAPDTADFEAAAVAHDTARYVLRLFVTGTTPHSTRAIVNIRKICEEHLQGRYELEIIDISHHPTLAEGEQIIAAPTLIKKLPLPLRRFIGDMSQTERILLGLDLRKKAEKPLNGDSR